MIVVCLYPALPTLHPRHNLPEFGHHCSDTAMGGLLFEEENLCSAQSSGMYRGISAHCVCMCVHSYSVSVCMQKQKSQKCPACQDKLDSEVCVCVCVLIPKTSSQNVLPNNLVRSVCVYVERQWVCECSCRKRGAKSSCQPKMLKLIPACACVSVSECACVSNKQKPKLSAKIKRKREKSGSWRLRSYIDVSIQAKHY